MFLGPVGSVFEVGSALTEIVTTLVSPDVVPITVIVVVAAVLIDCATKLTDSAVVVVLLGFPENLTILVFSIVQ